MQEAFALNGLLEEVGHGHGGAASSCGMIELPIMSQNAFIPI